jgi:hypothetical protein
VEIDMSEGIWVAVIGALATIVAAVIASWSRSRGSEALPPKVIPPVVSPGGQGGAGQGDDGNDQGAPPSIVPFPVVESREQIDENLRRLQAYLQAADEEEREFAKDLLRKAKCIVLSGRGGQLLVLQRGFR